MVCWFIKWKIISIPTSDKTVFIDSIGTAMTFSFEDLLIK